jgi:hypothetical protein
LHVFAMQVCEPAQGSLPVSPCKQTTSQRPIRGSLTDQVGGHPMKNFVRSVAVIVSAGALSIGLLGSPAEAARGSLGDSTSFRDTGWK